MQGEAGETQARQPRMLRSWARVVRWQIREGGALAGRQRMCPRIPYWQRRQAKTGRILYVTQVRYLNSSREWN